MQAIDQYDVLIIGGSYAGLSAAMTLGRSLRKVLIIDGERPANRQTPHAHNVITLDGATPAQITARAKEQVLAYPGVTFVAGQAVAAPGSDGHFDVATEAGGRFRARKLLLATGVEDLMPDLDGFAPCWGVSILHCPYCHGYEVNGQPLGLLANGHIALDLVKLIGHWSSDLTLLTNGPGTFTDEQRRFIGQQRVPVREAPISRLAQQNGQLQAVVFADGSQLPLRAIFTRVPFRQHTDLAGQLACELGQTGMMAGLLIVDELGRTTTKGVFAAGDATSPMRSLTSAMASGTKAGAMLNRELIEERFD